MSDFDVLSAIPVVNGRVSLDPNMFSDVDLGSLLTDWQIGTLVIENASIARKSGTGRVAITGVSAAFGLMNLPTEVALTLGKNSQVVLTIRFDLNSGFGPWHFSTSFPTLPQPAGLKQRSPLDAITFKTAVAILATGALNEPSSPAPLVRGLNFVGTVAGATIGGLSPTAIEGLSFTAPDPGTTIAGLPLPIASGLLVTGTLTPERIGVVTPRRLMQQFPWEITAWPLPGILLSVQLAPRFQLGPIPLTAPTLRLYSPLTQQWGAKNRSYPAMMGFTADAAVGSDGTVHLTAEVDQSGRFILAGDVDNLKLSNLAHLAGLAGPGDLGAALSDPLIHNVFAAAGALQLESVSVAGAMPHATFSLDFATLRVGYPDLNWTVWDDPPLSIRGVAVEFAVADPLGSGRALSACIIGNMTVAGVALDIYTTMPGFAVAAVLPDGVTLPLAQLFHQLDLPAPPDLKIDSLETYIAPGTSFGLNARLASDPGWTLDLGVLQLEVQSIYVDIAKTHGGTATAAFSGMVVLWDQLTLEVAYTSPGGFQASGRIPTIHLSDLWKRLSGIGIDMPFGDVELDQPYAAVTIEQGDHSFLATTLVAGLGELALSTRKTGGQTGVALGIVISNPRAPALGPIGDILDAVELQKLVLVVSSMDDTGFSFPDLAPFNAPTFAGTGVKLPANVGGVVKGVNVYARLGTTGDKGLGALFKLFDISVDGTVGVTLSVSSPNVQTNSKLFLEFTAHQVGLDFQGELGLLITGGVMGAFVNAKAKTSIQGHDVTFVVSAAVFESGLLLSGTMVGTISFGPVHLTDLALMLGADFAGVPSVGVAAQVQVSNFDSSLVVFFDSVNPAQSMFAGAVSDISLVDVITTFTTASVPHELVNVLPLLSLKGMESFDVPAAQIVDALDKQDHPRIAAALNPHDLNLGQTIDSFHVIVADPGKHWFIAHRQHDGKNRPLPHYELALDASGATVNCKLEPQIYFAPQATSVGALRFDAGCYLAAELDNLLLKAKLDINIDTSQGISAEVDIDRIQLLSADFLAITDATGQGGPQLSFATFSQPQLTDAARRPPHFIIDGKLRILGLDVSACMLTLGTSGLAFSFSEQGAFGSLSLSGSLDTHALGKMSATGTASFGFDRHFSAGLLGNLHLQATIGGRLTVSANDGKPSLTLQLTVAFMGLSADLPTVTISTAAFGDIPDKIADFVESAVFDRLKAMLGIAGGVLEIAKVAAEGLGAEVKDLLPLLQNIGAGASDIAGALSGVYHLEPDKVAKALLDLAHLSVTEIGVALKVGLNLAADGVATALKAAGLATEQIASALEGGFGMGADAVAGVLDKIGLPGDEIAGALKSVFNLSVDEMASVLKDTLNMGSDAARTVLQGAGYATDQVEGALSSAYDWAKENLNPSNW